MEQWDIIYKNNAAKMLGVCRRYVKDEQQAEDLMHNAFMTAMNKSDTYSGKGLFEGWLRRIAVNTALMFLRSNKKSAVSENEQIENYSEPVHEQEYSQETQRNTIEEADFNKQELLEVIDQLPDHHKTVFNLYVIDGFKHTEIGKMLNISPGTSKSHLARARKKIQELLFERAENKKKNKKRAFFFLFFTKGNYIDKMYKDAFTSFEIQPQSHAQLKDGSKLVNTHQKFSILSKIIGNKVILFASISSVLIIITAAVFILYPKNVSIQNKAIILPEPSKAEQQIIAEPLVKADSLIIENNVPPVKLNNNPLEQKSPAPIKQEITKPIITTPSVNSINKADSAVIKKTFIVHKSIIQHDTVIQKTPVNNEK